jgi:hypothetical protein
MIIHQIPMDFTKNIKERLFYNVPEHFASIDVIFSLREAKIGNVKFSHHLKLRPLKTTLDISKP